jgi:hypothetical protein
MLASRLIEILDTCAVSELSLHFDPVPSRLQSEVAALDPQ